MYKIYKITNVITKKVYIGLTSQSLKRRWQGHISDSKRKVSHQYHFLKAIRKYSITEWEQVIIESNLTKNQAIAREQYWIQYYDSYNNGYNSTLGGETPPIRKGINNSRYNNKIYTFYNSCLQVVINVTIKELCDTYLLDRSRILELVKNKIKTTKTGWAINKEYADDYQNRYKIIKTSTCKCGNQKSLNAITCFSCRDTSGKNNGMFNKPQSLKTKQAVSKMRQKSADQTKRTWINEKLNLIEENITCFELRNKYPILNISHLNKIAKKIMNQHGNPIIQHKGWRVCENK